MAKVDILDEQLGALIRGNLNSMFTELYNHIAKQIHAEAVHGLRVTGGLLEFFDGSVWKTVETEITELPATIISLVATGFVGNLDGTVTDVQALAEKVDVLDIPPHVVLKNYQNTVTTLDFTNEVVIGIPEYNKATDTLLVFINSTYLHAIVDYTQPDSLRIVKVAGTWAASEFNFVVIKLENV